MILNVLLPAVKVATHILDTHFAGVKQSYLFRPCKNEVFYYFYRELNILNITPETP
jgi:hypothetical protein